MDDIHVKHVWSTCLVHPKGNRHGLTGEQLPNSPDQLSTGALTGLPAD